MAEPKGHIPVELLDPKATPRLAYPGRARLTFPPQAEWGGRRVEWLDSEQEVRDILDLYNKAGKPPLFRIATDLVLNRDALERQQTLAADLNDLLGNQLAAICEKIGLKYEPIAVVVPEEPAIEAPAQEEPEAEVDTAPDDDQREEEEEEGAGLDLNPPGEAPKRTRGRAAKRTRK